ncbi:MAG: L-rhamnose isomerase [Clostridia bacterium]|nr:L-rhamnose isomerase [Clostridia bacterium]
MMNTQKNYEIARQIYAERGVDTDAALERLRKTPISIHCWQGDDVRGFLFRDRALSGGIQTTGHYPGAARTAAELRADLDVALSLIPSKHRLNLHAIYADTDEEPDLIDLEPRHFASWVDWAKERRIGLDFNPTCFSHPMADSGFTISSADPDVRAFWIEHCRRSRKISEYFGRELGTKSVMNLWFPDGYKDIPFDREAPRYRMMTALDEARRDPVDPACHLDALESKVFGIGAESYTVGSAEFALGYAVTRGIAYTLDAGHFHPTEVISDKIPSVLLYTKELMLHVSRPVRWDSDHVVILDDELRAIAQSLVRTGLIERTHVGLDFFDASINRIAAWVIGTRNMLKALLLAYLEPADELRRIELCGDYTSRLALTEELKVYPFAAVWDYYCERMGVPVREKWLETVRRYEKDVLLKRA